MLPKTYKAIFKSDNPINSWHVFSELQYFKSPNILVLIKQIVWNVLKSSNF